MIIVGLTGGIGSGKTTVANFFSALGVPVYIADVEAKKLMNRSKVIKRKLIALFGEDAYKDNELNRKYIAEIIFKNKEMLNKMNAIVHPKVAKHFIKWTKKQNASYIIKEVAILFENGSYTSCDFIITVTSPKQTRLKRVIKRDASTTKKVESIMKNQWEDDARIKLSDFVINNDNLEDTRCQVVKIHNKILKSIG
ncbi:dephospho-CoA kinase [Lacinutrix salivirga]